MPPCGLCASMLGRPEPLQQPSSSSARHVYGVHSPLPALRLPCPSLALVSPGPSVTLCHHTASAWPIAPFAAPPQPPLGGGTLSPRALQRWAVTAAAVPEPVSNRSRHTRSHLGGQATARPHLGGHAGVRQHLGGRAVRHCVTGRNRQRALRSFLVGMRNGLCDVGAG